MPKRKRMGGSKRDDSVRASSPVFSEEEHVARVSRLSEFDKRLKLSNLFEVAGNSCQFLYAGDGDSSPEVIVRNDDSVGGKGLFAVANKDLTENDVVAQVLVFHPNEGSLLKDDLLKVLNSKRTFGSGLSYPFVLRQSCGVVSDAGLVVKSSCAFKQGALRVKAFLGEVCETSMKGVSGSNCNFSNQSSCTIEQHVKGIRISREVKKSGALRVFNVKTTRNVKEGTPLKVFYSKEFCAEIRAQTKLAVSANEALEACLYGGHRVKQWYRCPGCGKRSMKLEAFSRHLSNHRNSFCYEAVYG